MPYFAYGSNLNALDLENWCQRQRLPYPLGARLGRAWLPDYQLVFDTYSATRRGGVANVVPRKGYAVPGVVFKIRKNGWRVLTIKEGAPTFYSKCDVVALVENAHGVTAPMACTTYRLTPAESFIAPSQAYLDAIAGAYEAYGFAMEQLRLASRDQDKPLPLFVYGTLQRGKRLHGYMHGFEFVGNATVCGRLLDCGSFPGLIRGEDCERVHGELYQIKPGVEPEDVFRCLDSIEGFGGFNRKNLYERRIIAAEYTDGKKTSSWCWSYHWMGNMGCPVITNGVWK